MATKKGQVGKEVPATAEKERRKRRTMSQNDMLAYWTESRVFIPQRLIYVGSATTDVAGNESGVDAAMVHKFDVGLSILEYFDRRAPVFVRMTSFGGEYTHAMNMVDRMRQSACPITIEGSGAVMSSGIILMQGAHTRILTRHSRVLVHYPEYTLSGRHIDDLVRQIGDAKSYNEEMERLFLKRMQVKRPELTLDQLRQKLAYDWTMDAHEAVNWGLADQVARSSMAQISTPLAPPKMRGMQIATPPK